MTKPTNRSSSVIQLKGAILQQELRSFFMLRAILLKIEEEYK